jgi:hypothetical protein
MGWRAAFASEIGLFRARPGDNRLTVDYYAHMIIAFSVHGSEDLV